MENINRYKPKWLPQLSAPYKYVVDELGKEGVESKLVKLKVNGLEPLQNLVDGDKVNNIISQYSNTTPIEPIFVSADNKIIDGHHRYTAHSMMNKYKPIECVKVLCDYQTAIRFLNKIQDIFDYSNKNTINFKEISDNKNQQKLVLFRSKPIIENSKSGNFFYTKQQGSKYEIEFDNLLEFLEDKIKHKAFPSLSLTMEMYPNVDLEEKFNKLNKDNNLSFHDFINRLVKTKLGELGYDGVKYGEKLVQTI